jgi:hypothetical protein
MCVVAALAASGGLAISESPPLMQTTRGGVFGPSLFRAQLVTCEGFVFSCRLCEWGMVRLVGASLAKWVGHVNDPFVAPTACHVT